MALGRFLATSDELLQRELLGDIEEVEIELVLDVARKGIVEELPGLERAEKLSEATLVTAPELGKTAVERSPELLNEPARGVGPPVRWPEARRTQPAPVGKDPAVGTGSDHERWSVAQSCRGGAAIG